MLKFLFAIPALGILALAQPAMAQPATHAQMCQGVFQNNRASIESLSKAGDTAGVQALFARAGCSDVALKLAQPSGQKSVTQISCSFTLSPLLLECHWGLAVGVRSETRR